MAEKIRNRNEIDAKYKWDLTHIYLSDEAWQEDYDRLKGKLPELEAFNGKVKEKPKEAIRTFYKAMEEFTPMLVYAFLRKETDNADPVAQGLKDKAERLYIQGMTATAYLQPEQGPYPQ